MTDEGGGERILLVEGEGPAASEYQRGLELEGFEVVVVADGKKAIEAAWRDEFQLILVTHSLPGATGLDVLRALHGRRRRMRVPVAMIMSDFADTELMEKAFLLGAVACLSLRDNPPARLAARVREWISGDARLGLT